MRLIAAFYIISHNYIQSSVSDIFIICIYFLNNVGSVTFHLVGDNVDVYQKPKYMTADRKATTSTGF